jgi:hypothetical protein
MAVWAKELDGDEALAAIQAHLLMASLQQALSVLRRVIQGTESQQSGYSLNEIVIDAHRSLMLLGTCRVRGHGR